MDDVLARLRAAAPELLSDTPVKVAYLFGSRARGEARPVSDVDVAVLAPDGSAKERFDLRLRLMGSLSEVLGAEADVIVIDDSPLTLVGRVVRDGIVVYSTDESLRAEFESRTFRLYSDFSRDEGELARLALRVMAGGR